MAYLGKAALAVNIFSFDTDDLNEGSQNKYFTDARVNTALDSYLSAGTGISVTDGEISLATTGVTAGDYGASNAIPVLHIDATGRITSVSTSSIDTDDVSEGSTNKYFTTAKVDDEIDAYLSAGTGIEISSGEISLASTGIEAGDYGSSTAIPTFTLDATGRITAIDTAAISSSLPIAGDSGTSSVSLLDETLTIAGGDGVITSVSGTTVTIGLSNVNYTQGEGTFSTLGSSVATIDSFSATTYRSAKYQVQLSSIGGYRVCDVLVLHDDTNATVATVNNLQTGDVGTFSASVSAGNVNVLFTPTAPDGEETEIIYIKTLINNTGSIAGILGTSTDMNTGTGTLDLNTGNATINLN